MFLFYKQITLSKFNQSTLQCIIHESASYFCDTLHIFHQFDFLSFDFSPLIVVAKIQLISEQKNWKFLYLIQILDNLIEYHQSIDLHNETKQKKLDHIQQPLHQLRQQNFIEYYLRYSQRISRFLSGQGSNHFYIYPKNAILFIYQQLKYSQNKTNKRQQEQLSRGRVFLQVFLWLLFSQHLNLQLREINKKMNTFESEAHYSVARNTNAIILIILFMKVWLLLFCLLAYTSSLACEAYILNLVKLYYQNKTEFTKQVAVYVASSGKLADDLGFPHSCVKDSNRSFFTAQIDAEGVENQYTVYLGICFTSSCDVEDMNQNGGIILNTLLNISVFDNSTATFYQPNLNPQTSSTAIIFIIVLIILILIGLKEGVQKLVKGCIKESKVDEEQSSKYQIKFNQDYDPNLLVIQQKQGFFKKNCLFTKIEQYCRPQETNKIIAFSSIRIISIPFVFCGYLFYLSNFGSLNYFSFNKQIYTTLFSKIALVSYYFPDIFFFMSGFLFAKKAFYFIQVENKPIKPLISLLARKFIRLYPLYITVILIYWLISPTLHGGPVWYVYQQQAAQCNSSWWRVLLLIDNWFQNGCYNYSWFIPVQFQLSLLNIVIFLCFAHKKKIGLIALGISLLASWILVLTISSPLPSSLETTLSYNAQKYFKSTYSHMPFYLFGVLNAYLGYSQSTKTVLQQVTQNNILKTILLVVGAFMVVLVGYRPEVWEKVLGFELGLARTGMFIGVYFFMFWGMFDGKIRKTYVHKIGSLSLGVLLIGGIIVSSSFWSRQTFPYLDGQFLLSYTITNCLIALIFGSLIATLVWPRPLKQETLSI